jgi:curved DNA-binding protein CbpA
METLYDVLGARPDDDAESLKNAYRNAAMANHPDRHASDPDATVRFTRIVAAYGVLRDARQRAAYDRLLERRRGSLERQRLPPPPKAKRAAHPAYQIAFNAIAGVVIGALAGGGYLLFVLVHGITDAGGMTAGQPHRMIAVGAQPPEQPRPTEPKTTTTAQDEEICKRDAAQLAHLRISQERDDVIRFERGLGCEKLRPQVIRLRESVDPPIDTELKAAAGDPVKDHGAESPPPEQPQSTEPKTTTMPQDEVCKRDAAQLEHLRISQERSDVIRFERELGCEKLRPQVIRLRESVDP